MRTAPGLGASDGHALFQGSFATTAFAACLISAACSGASVPDLGFDGGIGPGGNGNGGNGPVNGNGSGNGPINGNGHNNSAGNPDILGNGNSGGDDGKVSPTDAGTGSDSTCGSMEVEARVDTTETVVDVPGNVLFVFDKSSSMREKWNDQPKWAAANNALVAAFTPIQDKLRAGVIMYPCTATSLGTGTDTCDWLVDSEECITWRDQRDPQDTDRGLDSCPEVAPITSAPQLAIQEGAAFLSAWKAYWQMGDGVLEVGTPTELALLRAETALSTPPAGNTVLVLMTDGQPNCGSNEAAVVARLLQKNIKTFVVGLPGAQDGITVLDTIAKAGGTAPDGCVSDCFLSPANPTDLETELGKIASTTVTKTTVRTIQDCRFTLQPPAGADPADVHLIATSSADGKRYEIPRTPGNGWTLSADNTVATLEGLICEGAKAGSFSSFSFQYGCVSAPLLPPVK